MKLNFTVQNLKCGGCANSITKKLSSLEDVQQVHVDHENSLVEIEVSHAATEASLKDALYHLGYPVVGDKNPLSSKAKSFISCATGRMSK